MKRKSVISFALFLWAGFAYGEEICVSPVNPKEFDRGIVLPPPGDKDFGRMPGRAYVVQVDNGPKTMTSQSAGTVLQLTAGVKKHRFRVYRDGKLTQSINFPGGRQRKLVCALFDSQYESWSVNRVSSQKECGCGAR